MSIYADVYPSELNPPKTQVEQMFAAAMLTMPGFMKPSDIAQFGFNQDAWEAGKEVWFEKTKLDRVAAAKEIWERMNPAARLQFQRTFFNGAVAYTENILSNIEKLEDGKHAEAVATAYNALRKLQADLSVALNKR